MAGMKVLLAEVMSVFFAIFPAVIFSAPTIENFQVLPSLPLWLGEGMNISLRCQDYYSNITGVYANLTTASFAYSNIPFSIGNNGSYALYLSPTDHLSMQGDYALRIACNSNESVSYETSFTVSALEGKITGYEPYPSYSGDNISLYYEVTVNGDPIKELTENGPNFSVYVDGTEREIKCKPPGYFNGKGWRLVLGSDYEKGPHSIEVRASYSRARISSSGQLNISDSVIFEMGVPSQTLLAGGEVLDFTVKAYERGKQIEMNSSNLYFDIGGQSVPINSIVREGSSYRVQLIAPALSPGSYSLRATLPHKGFSYFASRDLYYVIPVSGRIADADDKPIYAQIDFFFNSIKNVSLTTDSSGRYSAKIKPGLYDISFTFPHAALFVNDVYLSSFSDPIKYDYSASVGIDGINAIAVYAFEFAMPFSSADITMDYNEKLVNDERNLMVFRCPNWNFAKRECNAKWLDADSGADTIRNKVTLHTSSVEAYAIGIRKNLSSSISTEKNVFYLGENVKVSGIVYAGEERVSNASVRVSVRNSNITKSAFTGESGEFQLDFLADLKDGNYTLDIIVEKAPYNKFNSTRKIEVVKKRELQIVAPSTIRIKQGATQKYTIELRNSGQINLTQISFSVSGIPDEWYSVENNYSSSLAAGESAKLQVSFSAPADADASTVSIDFNANAAETTATKKAGFTVLADSPTTTMTEQGEAESNAPSGFVISMPNIGYEYVIAAITAVSIMFLVAVAKVAVSRRKQEKKKLLAETKSVLKENIRQTENDPFLKLNKDINDYFHNIQSQKREDGNG